MLHLPRGTAMLGLALLFAALLISRDPHVLTQAELWGDDGWSWYPDAYNHGLASLLTPVGGYLNSLQRVGGLLGQLVPLRWVPTLFVVFALGVQVLPPLFIASSRMGDVVPSAGYRLLMAFVYLMMPYTIEAHANLTNAQWHLAALAFLVLVARSPATRGARCFDLGVLAMCGLSGPFCLMLLPIAGLRLWHERSRDDFSKVAVLLAALFVQAAMYFGGPAGARSAAPLGAGPRMLARIVATQVLLGAELGYRTISRLPDAAFWQGNVLPVCICAAALVLAAVALLRGGWALRGLCLFAGLVLAAALAKPQVSQTHAQWPFLAVPPIGNRYFMMPMLAWIGVVFTLAADRNRALRGIGIVLLAIIVGWGIPRGWKYIDFPRPDFVSAARAFETTPVGRVMSFPQLPPGTSPMWLIKR
jgi:hypothetical protein